MHLIQILLPRADNDGQAFPRQAFDGLKRELADEFNGVTAYLQAPAEGLWDSGREISRDDIVIFEVMAESLDLTSWRARRTELETRFRQERVVIRYIEMGVV